MYNKSRASNRSSICDMGNVKSWRALTAAVTTVLHGMYYTCKEHKYMMQIHMHAFV